MSDDLRRIMEGASREISRLARTLIEKDAGERVRYQRGGKHSLPHVRGEVRNTRFMLGTIRVGDSFTLNKEYCSHRATERGHLALYETRESWCRVPNGLFPNAKPGRRGMGTWSACCIWSVPLADPKSLHKAAEAIATKVGRKLPGIEGRAS